MPSPLIEKLLVLQEFDAHCESIKHQLRSIPLEVKDFERKIEAEKQSIENLKNDLQEQELRRNELEAEVGATEEQVVKYKNQQLLVKKNDEYQALQHEINTLASKIGQLEDEELVVMLAIDENKKNNTDRTSKHLKFIEELKDHISRLQKNHSAFQAELDSASKEVETASAQVDEKSSKAYQYVKAQVKNPPFVVPLRRRQCTGCYLKVSNEIETSARSQNDLCRCDNCGRIVYFSV